MNRVAVVAVLLAASAAVFGQAKITAQFSNPTAGRPPLVRLTLLNGGAEITGYDGKDVEISTRQDARRASRDRKRDRDDKDTGMRRIDFDSGFSVQEDNNIINIHGTGGGSPHLILLVPRAVNLEVKCTNCSELKIDSIAGDIDINTTNAGIRLSNVTGAVLAHSLNHSIYAAFDKAPAKPLSFSTMNGSIDLTFPSDLKSQLTLKSTNGKINTDFDIRLAAGTLMHPVRGMTGTINGGGPELSIRSFNGSIYIRRKK